MAALARWCIRRSVVVIVLWLAAFAGVAVAAAVTGSAYSNNYDIPGTDSFRSRALLAQRVPGPGGDSDAIVWHTAEHAGTVRLRGRRAADDGGAGARRRPARRRLRHRPVRHRRHQPQVSADQHTAYATVTFRRSPPPI